MCTGACAACGCHAGLLRAEGRGRGAQVVPLYLAEMAPAQSRGTMNVLFQLMITIGCSPCPAV